MISFTCHCGNQSTSEIDCVVNENKFFLFVNARCSHCGEMKEIKVFKEQVVVPNQSHDEPPKA